MQKGQRREVCPADPGAGPLLSALAAGGGEGLSVFSKKRKGYTVMLQARPWHWSELTNTACSPARPLRGGRHPKGDREGARQGQRPHPVNRKKREMTSSSLRATAGRRQGVPWAVQGQGPRRPRGWGPGPVAALAVPGRPTWALEQSGAGGRRKPHGPQDLSALLWDRCPGPDHQHPTTKPIQAFGFVWPKVRLHQCLLQKLPCERDRAQKRGSGFPPTGALCLNSVHALE